MPVIAEIIDTDTDRITLKSEFQHRETVLTLPSTRWSSAEGAWKLPLAWTSCLALRTTFKDQLVIGPKLQAWAENEIETKIVPAMTLRVAPNLEGVLPDHPMVAMAKRTGEEMKLFPHQSAGAAFMAISERVLITDETGTGKSAQAIGAIRTMHRMHKDVFPVLIVAPNSVKKPWVREWERWWPGIQVQLVSGGSAERRAAFEKPAHVYIINWELLVKHSRLASYGNTALKRCKECGGLDERISAMQCEVHLKELNQLRFQTVVADEIHRGKSPMSKQTRALWGASEHAQFRYGLTGTPIQDTITDLWALLHFVSPTEYPSKTRFNDRFADMGYNMWGAMQIFGIKDAMKDEFFAGTDPRFRRMLKKGVLKFLPPIVRETRYVTMPLAQKKAYKQMVKDTVAELEGGGTLIAAGPLSRATRLLQFSSSYAELITKELPDGRVEQRAKLSLPSGKITAFLHDIEAGDFGESSLVVFAKSKQLIDLLSLEMARKSLPHGLITGGQTPDERQQAIDDFQEKKFKYILVTIDAGGVGLTLTAADTMVFLQRSWSSTAQIQAEARAHRIGSEIHESVTIIDYIAEDTIEESQNLRLGEKYGRIEAIVRDRAMLLALLEGDDMSESVTEGEPIALEDDPEVD